MIVFILYITNVNSLHYFMILIMEWFHFERGRVVLNLGAIFMIILGILIVPPFIGLFLE
jgi:hypothetical protein